jgi:hypothetical protein
MMVTGPAMLIHLPFGETIIFPENDASGSGLSDPAEHAGELAL